MEKGELHVRCPSCKRGYHLRWRPGAIPVAAHPANAAQAVVQAEAQAQARTPALAQPRAEAAAPQEGRRARRFARALAEGILQGAGRRERRDRALAEGRLLQEFGTELSAAWRLYVDKVGEEFAHSSPYFRDAFNEILADGRQLF
jgi:hypothetical protein